MRDAYRREATKIVIGWITETLGEHVADYWAWERTPMPIALPSDEQLEEGLRLACGGPPVVGSGEER